MLRRVCVFCGSSPGTRPEYLATAVRVGSMLAERGIELVFGGSDVGCMAALANAALARGGHVIGVIPQHLVDKEVAHRGLSDLRVVGSMHERKALMADLADAFIALPGGYGTLDEWFEILTWAQMKIHEKPCGLLNVAGYFDPMIAMLDHGVAEGFLKPQHRAIPLVDSDPVRLLDRLTEHAPVVAHKLDLDRV